MRYSNEMLDDDNFDEEVEKLSEIIGIDCDNYDTFAEKLDKGFKLQIHNLGFEEWVKCGLYPNFSCDCRQAIQKGELAYEFGNGFVIFDFEEII